MIYLFISLILTFSYKIVEVVLRVTPYRSVDRYTVLIWGFIVGILALLFNKNYIFKMPVHYDIVLPVFVILIITNVIAARFAGYNPNGKYNIVNFIFTFPIVEEVVFRGMILLTLEQITFPDTFIEVLNLPVTIPVIITACLFAICHLQYYKLSTTSIRYMIFAFLGGILLGAMTVVTESILLALVLHVVFNASSVLYSKRIIRI